MYHASFYPCTVSGACRGPEPWELSWFFMHSSWDHILGNMLFLAIFGKNLEDAFGHLLYPGLYIAGGLVACATQTAVTLIAGSASAATVPALGASGAIAAVLGACFVRYPGSRVLTLVLIFLVRVSAWVLLSVWFLCSCTSSLKPTTVLPRPTPTAAASHSSPMSAASCSALSSPRGSTEVERSPPRPAPCLPACGKPRRQPVGHCASELRDPAACRRRTYAIAPGTVGSQ